MTICRILEWHREALKLRWRVSRRRDEIYFNDFTQVARFSRLWNPPRCGVAQCTMRNTVCVFLGETREEQVREETAIATADNGGSGQKNNRCFRAYGNVRRILRTILALWCKCRSESREKALRIYEPWIERPIEASPTMTGKYRNRGWWENNKTCSWNFYRYFMLYVLPAFRACSPLHAVWARW